MNNRARQIESLVKEIVLLEDVATAARRVLEGAPMGHTMLTDLEDWQQRLRDLLSALKEAGEWDAGPGSSWR
jgi:hypothetical protein